ncbi:hypothetical protein Btru_069032 [Bulinus truncatus]|nr:hypothetical protein Btru_069032 [Bulinus truncatus]
MSSNDVIKSVAKKLKYYFEVKRLEDGFDLSDTHQPQLDHPPLKVVGWSSQYDIDLRPALQGGVLRDKPLKHYFSHSEVRGKLTHLNGKNAREPLRSKREIQVRKLLDNYMKNYCFQNTLPSSYCYHQSKVCPHGLYTSGGLRRRKKHRNLIGGWPLLRTVPDQHITKGEATRLVNSATKILAASTSFGLYPGAVDYSLVKNDPSLYKRTQPKKQITAKYSPVYSPKERTKSNRKVLDESDTDDSKRWSSYSRPQSPTPSTDTSRSTKSDGSSYTKSSQTNSSDATEDTIPSPRPNSARFKSQAFISLPKTEPQEEVGIVQSTQTVDFFDEPLVKQHIDKVEEEVHHGPLSEYEVYVTTGNRLGASTKAPIKIIMYGEKGRTKEFVLEQSKRHKIPFQKGKEDLFVLSTHHIGQIKKIQIGHDRPELNYAWYLEGVTVYDMHAKRIFQFPCERWLSGQDGDKKTYRILEVDKERHFMEALDKSMSKSPRTPRNKDSSGSESSDILVNGRGGKNLNKTNDIEQIHRTDTSERGRRGSDDDLYSPGTKDFYKSQPRVVQSKTMDDEKQKSGPVIRLHSAHDNKQVDEIFIGTQARIKENQHPQRRIVNDNKEDNSQSEEEKRYQLERERAMERSMLQGKGIHDAVRAGDLERVKDLINQFNEMKDFKDGSGWTPIHLAAARGNIDILRWLVTSDADINAVTPSGLNAMHISAMHGHVNSMMVLQAMGCSIASLTLEKQSALHLAAENGHLECVKWLVANRASITQEDSKGKTACQLAEDKNWDHCAEFLNVCVKELTNPKSSFYQINRNGNGNLSDRDGAYTVSSETPRNMKETFYD